MDRSTNLNTADDGSAERKQRLAQQITLWVGNQRLADAMEREAIAQLEGAQRHFALNKAAILNDIRILRAQPRASALLAVNHLISALCDNNQGCCWLSMKRMGDLFGRTERSIRDLVDTLEETGVLFVERKNGLPSRYWPSVPSFLKNIGVSVTAYVEALTVGPKRPGRPVLKVVKNPRTVVPRISENPGTFVPPFSEIPRNTSANTPEDLAHSISLRTSLEEGVGLIGSDVQLNGPYFAPTPTVRSLEEQRLEEQQHGQAIPPGATQVRHATQKKGWGGPAPRALILRDWANATSS